MVSVETIGSIFIKALKLVGKNIEINFEILYKLYKNAKIKRNIKENKLWNN